jgi:hypothetical protein
VTLQNGDYFPMALAVNGLMSFMDNLNLSPAGHECSGSGLSGDAGLGFCIEFEEKGLVGPALFGP